MYYLNSFFVSYFTLDATRFAPTYSLHFVLKYVVTRHGANAVLFLIKIDFLPVHRLPMQVLALIACRSIPSSQLSLWLRLWPSFTPFAAKTNCEKKPSNKKIEKS